MIRMTPNIRTVMEQFTAVRGSRFSPSSGGSIVNYVNRAKRLRGNMRLFAIAFALFSFVMLLIIQ